MVPSGARRETTKALLSSLMHQNGRSSDRAHSLQIVLVGCGDTWARSRQWWHSIASKS